MHNQLLDAVRDLLTDNGRCALDVISINRLYKQLFLK